MECDESKQNDIAGEWLDVSPENIEIELKEWNEVISKINYLDWTIRAGALGDFQYCIKLFVDAKVVDSEPPHIKTIIHHTTSFGHYPKGKDWKVRQIFRFLCHIQVHEASEFFNYDGDFPFHAHKSDKFHQFEYPVFGT